jgi:hypothetical protein
MSQQNINNYGDNHGNNNYGANYGVNYVGVPPSAEGPAREPDFSDYEPVEPDGERYDIAFSFAGDDRDYVERTRRACGRLGLRVMYDRDLGNHWWGENYLVEQRKIYGAGSWFFVPFISSAYFRRRIPADEFAAAMWADVERGGGYILPVLIGDGRVPAHLLPRHVGFLRAEDHSPVALAVELRRKVDRARSASGT